MIEFFLYSIIALVVLGTLANLAISAAKKKEEQTWARLESKLRVLHGFRPSQKIMAMNNTAIALDEQSRRLCLIKEPHGCASVKVLPYRDVVESEVIENGVSVTKTSRSGQVGGALVGGLLLGGVGAVVGGLSAKKTTTNRVTSVDLRVVVNDTREPTYTMRFPLRQQADHWYALISLIIRQADKEEGTTANPSGRQDAPTPRWVADEIAKLSALMEKGLITRGEFQAQKARLLS
jgi:hypothetical protein